MVFFCYYHHNCQNMSYPILHIEKNVLYYKQFFCVQKIKMGHFTLRGADLHGQGHMRGRHILGGGGRGAGLQGQGRP